MGLEEEFADALVRTYEEARERGYVATYFQQMLAKHRGVGTAKRLLASKEPQTGLFELYHLDMLADSLEAIVLQEKYKPLFTEEELAEAYKRLEELDYFKNKED